MKPREEVMARRLPVGMPAVLIAGLLVFSFLSFLLNADARAAGGSCYGSCGGTGGGCGCDTGCKMRGDCCVDYKQYCGDYAPGSCNGACNGSAGSCYCDNYCAGFGDCCPDACYFCGAFSFCPPVTGDVCGAFEPDCNPYLGEHGALAVNRMRSHGDLMGSFQGTYPDFDCGVRCPYHWQGFQRLANFGSYSDGRFMVIDSSGDCDNVPAKFAVIKMNSRSAGGERYRSNRLVYGQSTWNMAPPDANDKITWWDKVKPYDSYGHPQYGHPGGMQAIGKYLLIPLDHPCSGGNSGVSLYNLYNPLAPIYVKNFPLLTNQAATAGIAKLANGKYLLAVGQEDSVDVHFYLSNGTNVELSSAEFHRIATWHGSGDWITYQQSMNLVTDYAGRLFLMGTTKSGGGGNDTLSAFLLEVYENGNVAVSLAASKTMVCGTPDDHLQCNFDAAAGVYVTPAHKLVLYASEHDNDGPSGSIKMMEFRPVADLGTAECPTVNQAWVELYQDSNFGGRSVMLDYVDRGKRKTVDFAYLDSFNDMASSIKYCIPAGYKFTVYRHNTYGGGFKTYSGSGIVQADSNLHDNTFSDGSTVGDNISSAKWGP